MARPVHGTAYIIYTLHAFLGPISYGIVEPWEGILTFLFFPATVWTAYVAERRLFCYKYMSKSYRAGKTHQLLYHIYTQFGGQFFAPFR